MSMHHGPAERRQTNSRYFRKKKNTRDLYGGISELIRGATSLEVT
jgi:hypothetical protein